MKEKLKKEGIIYAAKPHAWTHRNEWVKNENVYLHFYPLCIIKKSVTLIIWHNNRYSPYAVLFGAAAFDLIFIFVNKSNSHSTLFFSPFFWSKILSTLSFCAYFFFSVCLYIHEWLNFFFRGTESVFSLNSFLCILS